MNSKLILILSLIFIFYSCNDECKEIGDEYKYILLRDQTDRGIGKFSWDMQIDRPISKAQIKINAEILRCQKPGYDRYYISYFLPNYQLDAGAWAIAHFDPTLKIEILELQGE